MITKLRQRLRRGQLYTGPAAWCDDYAAVPRPGFYALTPDGKKILPKVPLVCVDDAPGNALDGSCHYEYAGPKDMPQRQATGGPVPSNGNTVEMEPEAFIGRMTTEV
jgi:hypothetical protein